jgi:hypothetical protein
MIAQRTAHHHLLDCILLLVAPPAWRIIVNDSLDKQNVSTTTHISGHLHHHLYAQETKNLVGSSHYAAIGDNDIFPRCKKSWKLTLNSKPYQSDCPIHKWISTFFDWHSTA